MLGMATSTSAPAVGVRVPFIRPRLGAVAIMALSDERLGQIGLNLLELGYKAPGVIEQLVVADPNPEYRQLGVVDDDGFAAARTGTNLDVVKDWSGHHCGDGYIVLGNFLKGRHVIDAMEEAYLADPDQDLEHRLMQALEAGRDAGGEMGDIDRLQSAALLVYDRKTFSRVNLRVDMHSDPVGELRRVFNAYLPYIPYYVVRQVDPTVGYFGEWSARNG
jgi:uncharacterized Ntn-hydrolase superfamily protein